ncbi:alpha/beta hydrolase [Rhodocyclus tenuis]|uniref:alpha/beta hydrolase n=1 Tax=Rhodocyclus tenuis TaxID=1066 RepID=UPI00190323A3|nr:alpha/beta fold hydrolase [Rhodocyclus tenuis]MBK1681418.1 carboxylesterase [Rhodocyclus tenuis]
MRDNDAEAHARRSTATTENPVSAHPIELTSGDKPDFALIWLHGLGADGSDFVPIVAELHLPVTLSGRFIFPHAPYQPVTCNGGYEMRAWYDILSLAPDERRVDVAGLQDSVASVHRLIAREVERGIPARRIVLAGFSQGGAVAYTAALTCPDALAGVIALSTYLPAPELISGETRAANAQLPIFAAHGDEDDVVAPALGLRARDFLRQQGYQPEWHTYPMAHGVCDDEISDIGRWLTRQLGTQY